MRSLQWDNRCTTVLLLSIAGFLLAIVDRSIRIKRDTTTANARTLKARQTEIKYVNFVEE